MIFKFILEIDFMSLEYKIDFMWILQDPHMIVNAGSSNGLVLSGNIP